MPVIDRLDRRIVDALVQDGRRPFVRIAAELGVSEASIRQRVSRLTSDGVMQIMAVTNPLKMGFGVLCIIGLSVDKAAIDDASRVLGEMEEVTYLIACTGRYDFLVEVVCEDNRHLLDFLAHRLGSVEGVRDAETFTCLAVLKESYRAGRASDLEAPAPTGT